MQNDDQAQKAIDRRSFLKSAAVGTAAFAAGTSLLSWARPAKAAGSLANVQSDAAKAAKELAGGRVVTLRILEPSGSLGNIKPVADRWTADTGIKVEYIEVPLGEINQKVLLEAVSKAGSFDIALPASFGITEITQSARQVPTTPAIRLTSMLSKTKSRTTPPREAPSAMRNAISRRRPVNLTSSKFATLLHAIRNTNPTAPSKTKNG